MKYGLGVSAGLWYLLFIQTFITFEMSLRLIFCSLCSEYLQVCMLGKWLSNRYLFEFKAKVRNIS